MESNPQPNNGTKVQNEPTVSEPESGSSSSEDDQEAQVY